MVKMVFEEVYSQYHCKQKIAALSEYLGKIPGSSDKKFVKMLVFGSQGVAIYNVSQILISESIGKGEAETTPGQKVVRIMYTGDESSKVCTCKHFANMCKGILSAVEKLDDKDLTLEAMLEGSNKPSSFRLYYDNTTKFVILVRNTNEKGVEKFLEEYKGDLAAAIELPKNTRSSKPKDTSFRVDKNTHEGYQLINKTDAFGHKIKIWRRKDMIKPDGRQLDKYSGQFAQ